MTDKTEWFDEKKGISVERAKGLFSEQVIDHFNNPRNVGEMDDPDRRTRMSGTGGDTIAVFVGLEDRKISGITFLSTGGGVAKACGSALTCMAQGMTIDQVIALKAADLAEYLGGLPAEHTHCAKLAVDTLRSALGKVPDP